MEDAFTAWLVGLGVDATRRQKLRDEGISNVAQLSGLEPQDLVDAGFPGLLAKALVGNARREQQGAAQALDHTETSLISVGSSEPSSESTHKFGHDFTPSLALEDASAKPRPFLTRDAGPKMSSHARFDDGRLVFTGEGRDSPFLPLPHQDPRMRSESV